VLFEVERSGEKYIVSLRTITPQPVAELGLLEKDIENWIADRPNIILPNEKILVIGQSISGQSMADVLAIDEFGRLVIVEVKRSPTSRDTVAQLLGYAARMHRITYDELNAIAKSHSEWSGGELEQTFADFTDGARIPRDQLGREHRIVIVAPDSDADLKSIVSWLRHYGLPVDFVPFSIYADESATPRYLQIDGIVSDTEPARTSEDRTWMGHWIFNTNETNVPDAYERMFERGVAAIYGYPNGPKNLEGAEPNQIVLAYVNRQGLRAVGSVRDGEVRAGAGIFVDAEGNQLPGEFHLAIDWNVKLSEANALSAAEAAQLGYNLPVRLVFGRLHSGREAQRLVQEMQNRV
jgi:hypothetical protein